MSAQYSHRNGETEPPTVAGFYFVRHLAQWHDQEASIIYVEYDMDEDGFGAGWRTWRIGRDYESSFDELDKRLQWWGPIMPPWEEA